MTAPVPAVAPDPALVDRVRRRLAETGRRPSAADVATALRDEGGALHGDDRLRSVLHALQDEIIGAGPLEPLLRDPLVTDVLVNAPGEVWVDRGQGLERTRVRFPDEAAVRRLAQRLAAPTGRRLDDAQPWVDARLAGGVRLHAVLPPVAPAGTCLSLRVPRRRAFALSELQAAGALPQDGVDLLRRLVASRSAFLVTGGTGTGKTTLLSALLGLVAPADRVLLVEDAGELAPAHPHVVRLEARPPNLEGAGAVTLRDLVRQALRMRPDRLVVGEVRGRRSPTCSPRSTPGTRAAAARCTPTPPVTSRPVWRPSLRSPGCPARRCTASWRAPCTWSCTWCAPPAVVRAASPRSRSSSAPAPAS